MNPNGETHSISMENANLNFFIHSGSFKPAIEKQWRKPLHSHIYYEILFFPTSGSSLIIRDKEFEMAKNSFAIIAPDIEHAAIFEHSNLNSIGFYLERNRLNNPKENVYKFIDSILPDSFVLGESNEGLSELFQSLGGFYAFKSPISNGFVLAELLQILYSILAILSNTAFPLKSIQPKPRKHYHPYNVSLDTLYKVDGILNSEYTEDITAESIAKQLFISPRQINRYILSQYNHTFIQRRTQLRMTAAEKLLMHTSSSIGEIARSVGYNSINTFYSAFKKHFGVTPNEYRLSRQRKG